VHDICGTCLEFVFMTKRIIFMMVVQAIMEFYMLQRANFKVFVGRAVSLPFSKDVHNPIPIKRVKE